MATTYFLGEIRPFSFPNPPRNWALCNGQLLPLAQNQALFSILGTTYGGDGVTTFALPNLRGRVAIGTGPSVGGTTYLSGQFGGSATVALTSANIPAHTHTAFGSTATTAAAPGSTVLPGTFSAGSSPAYTTSAASLVPMGAATLGTAVGGGAAHGNLQPSLVLNYCIALAGIYPSR